MIHDGCGPANYTAWQNNFCLSFSRAHRSARWTPFFALIVEIILVRKSRKTPRSRPLPPSRPGQASLLLSPRFLFILSSMPPLRGRIRIMIRHFAGIPARLVTHRLLVQILQTPDTKAAVMTLAKNVDDTEITFVFTRWCCAAPPRCYLGICSFVSILIARSRWAARRLPRNSDDRGGFVPRTPPLFDWHDSGTAEYSF